MVLKKWLCYLLILFPCLSYCAAGNIHIFPAALEIKSGQTKTSFKVNNKGEEPMTFQLKAVKWEQKNGEDTYTDSNDIILNPPMITIAPGDYQLIRLGLREPLNMGSEHSYRVFLKQVKSPEKSTANKSDTISASITSLIEFRLPLFIAPKNEQKDLGVAFKTLSDGRMQVHLRNNGNQHIRLSEVSFYSDLSLAQSDNKEDKVVPLFAQAFPLYLFPSNEKTFILDWKKPKEMKDFVAKLKTDWGNLFETHKQAS